MEFCKSKGTFLLVSNAKCVRMLSRIRDSFFFFKEKSVIMGH